MNQLLFLTEDLEKGLIGIENSNDTRLQKCIKKIKLCESLINNLKLLYRKKPKIDPDQEIHFFKKIKPQFTVELHYQNTLFAYFKNKPRGTIKEKKVFINQELERISAYLQRYNEFYTYYKTGSEYLDHLFYRQIEFDIKIHAMLEHPLDREFTCPAGPTLTCVICAEKVIQFLKNELFMLKNPHLDPSWEKSKTLSWKGSKTDLVELIYALHSTGKVDSDLKQIVAAMEHTFNIDIGNNYRTFTEIKRKKNPTAFINELETCLLEKVKSEF